MEDELTQKTQKTRWKKWLKYTYLTFLYLFAAMGVFIICLYIAVEFKLTNVDGAIDLKNRYFSEMADKYGNELIKDGASNPGEEVLVFQKIGVIAKYRP